jgi:hypothetical protein
MYSDEELQKYKKLKLKKEEKKSEIIKTIDTNNQEKINETIEQIEKDWKKKLLNEFDINNNSDFLTINSIVDWEKTKMRQTILEAQRDEELEKLLKLEKSRKEKYQIKENIAEKIKYKALHEISEEEAEEFIQAREEYLEIKGKVRKQKDKVNSIKRKIHQIEKALQPLKRTKASLKNDGWTGEEPDYENQLFELRDKKNVYQSKKYERRTEKWDKRKTIISEWRKNHPNGTRKECLEETGVPKCAIKHYWNI